MDPLDRTTLIVLAARRGDPVDARTFEVPNVDQVIAVDSGLHLAVHLGLTIDVVIGDLDSVAPNLLAEVRESGVEVDVHPRDKDHTDLALALQRARADGATDVLIVGGAGGRLDHGLANLLAMADPSLAGMRVRAELGGARIAVARDAVVTIAGRAGSLVSLLAVGGSATVVTAGLRWDLHEETLAPTDTRGVSNELLANAATVHALEGVLLIIQPVTNEALEL